jgi:hypothetical protein
MFAKASRNELVGGCVFGVVVLLAVGLVGAVAALCRPCGKVIDRLSNWSEKLGTAWNTAMNAHLIGTNTAVDIVVFLFCVLVAIGVVHTIVEKIRGRA